MTRVFLILVFILQYTVEISSQTDSASVVSDSTTLAKEQKKKIYASPRKASILSACLPGLGQAYNKKYWKIPLIYGVIGGFSYIFYVNNTQYNNYRRALKSSLNDPNGRGTIDGLTYSTDQLQSQKLYYRKYRDFAGIGIGIIYLLNIIDANVDAHLKTFDVSDDLSMSFDPLYNIFYSGTGYGAVTGLSIKINFK